MSFSEKEYEALLFRLKAASDLKYKAFHESLIPGVTMSYGVKVPFLRSLAKEVIRKDAESFLAVSRPDSYEEIMLRGFVIAGMKASVPHRLQLTQDFLPLIDNWAICDTFVSTFSLKAPGEKEGMWELIQPLFSSERTYFARFALVMLLSHYVDEEHLSEGLSLLERAKSEDYYVQMAAAWALSVFYVKFPQQTLPLLRAKRFSPFVQNKGIQKIRESRRVSAEQKQALLAFRFPKTAFQN